MSDNEIMFLQYCGGMNPGETFFRQCPELRDAYIDEEINKMDMREIDDYTIIER